MNNTSSILSIVLSFFILFVASTTSEGQVNSSKTNEVSKDSILKILEANLFKHLINTWYPLNIDSVNGGFISEFDYDWNISKGKQVKSLVQQARHVWSTAFLYEAYPDKQEFLNYSAHGFKFLKEYLWDSDFGGFHSTCLKDGTPNTQSIKKKEAYGQSFAIYGLSQYYKVSNDPEALELAKKAFLWMEEHVHDKKYGGYFDKLKRDGTPIMQNDSEFKKLQAAGLKDFNSSIHIMEGFTQLYLIWPDSLVRKRLEEMFYLIRDTFTHPHGYLQLYFHADWTLVDFQTVKKTKKGNPYFVEHFSYGHDVETAYLLLETAEVLGLKEDKKTHQITKLMVDHSLASGWDNENGGFFDGGKEIDGEIKIIHNRKSWWGQAEGLNALLLMHSLYPNDQQKYYSKFVKMWNYIDTYLIDKENKGWYSNGLDTYPASKKQAKSYVWKTTYHTVRAMVNCMKKLKETKNKEHNQD